MPDLKLLSAPCQSTRLDVNKTYLTVNKLVHLLWTYKCQLFNGVQTHQLLAHHISNDTSLYICCKKRCYSTNIKVSGCKLKLLYKYINKNSETNTIYKYYNIWLTIQGQNKISTLKKNAIIKKYLVKYDDDKT